MVRAAMMGHPGAAMHMAMMHQQMGMMPPHMWQKGMPQPMHPMMGRVGPGAQGGESSSGSSDSDSSSDSSDSGRGPPMWPIPAMENPVPGQVEAFLSAAPDVDQEVADRLRSMSTELQTEVMRRGPLDTRSPTSNLLSRMRQAEAAHKAGTLKRGPVPGIAADAQKPARHSAKAQIEAMISEFRLTPGCAWMLRSLPPDKQKLAAKIDPSGQPDPSGYVADELKEIV